MAVKYQINAVTTVVNTGSSVVELDGVSGATDVGAQLLSDSGAVFLLGMPLSFTGYNTAGGNFTIPLRARYIQTASAVSSGIANNRC